MALIFRHFWVAFIVVTLINGGIWWWRSKPYRERDPSLTESYRSLILGFITWGNIPWVIMAAGILIGDVPSIFHYFNPRSSSPFVLAWFGSLFFLWLIGSYWLFARGGAEKIVRHPGLLQDNVITASGIKRTWVLGLAGGIAAVIAMHLVDFQPPSF